MEQHPIPQQISSYQFKLVGDMTLKQFFQVAGGVVVSLIFYSTPLHPLIKWPFILFFAGLGAAMAFLPFEERPLEKWIVAFFRSIYSPTLYSWKKLEKQPIFYTESATAPSLREAVIPLSRTPATEIDTQKLDVAEKSFLQKIGGLFSVTGGPIPQNTSNQNGQMATLSNGLQPSNDSTIQPLSTPMTVAAPVGSITIDKPVDVPTTQQQSSHPTIQPLTVPSQVPVTLPKTTPKFVVEESGSSNVLPAQQTTIDSQKIEAKPISSDVVEFSIDAAPPSPPIAPNTIVGQVMDQERKIIEGAILEIKDSNGRPVRALKSNKAGHFIIVTPLQNGKYEVTIEKDGFKFEPVSFDAVGNMIPAIAIRGTRIA